MSLRWATAAAIVASAVIIVAAFAALDSDGPTAATAPTATERGIPPPSTPNAAARAEEDAWACASAWGSLPSDQLNQAYAVPRALPEIGVATAPQKILDLIDKYCP